MLVGEVLNVKLGGIEGKNQLKDRYKGGFTYTLLFCVLGVSFRGGIGGGIQRDFNLCFKTCVPQVTRQVHNLFQDLWNTSLGFFRKI